MNNIDVIKLLPDSVANQIAAGEVIQRPASVIKELVENAIDAGARSVSIILKDAGRTLIQVIDDGCGMSPADARMAFERHATSKISAATDLYSLHTMGFRGEALPSIAAVAQIDMRTMRRDDAMGCRVRISESRFEGIEPVATVPGTNIMVKNIFFHMPARRKFLKKDSVELTHILREFERLALVNTDVDFTLIHNDVTLHKFLRGTLKQRIADLFGKSLPAQLAPLATDTSLVRISGFVAMPAQARKRGYQQFFFVNGRNMRHPFFHKAVMACYDRLIPADSQPSYFIDFQVDPATIDVNIHPQKHEIKFENEQAIWQILTAAIKETLGKVQAAGALDFDMADAPEIPIFNHDTPETPDDPAIEVGSEDSHFADAGAAPG
ncbi:MAG: DNA mismatch repair endonuclease MutL, partial [Muribaculaceae bacterium]|nr:DNA mismatch repair endonuclease MutL [Muribaculaceae bacterium]